MNLECRRNQQHEVKMLDKHGALSWYCKQCNFQALWSVDINQIKKEMQHHLDTN